MASHVWHAWKTPYRVSTQSYVVRTLPVQKARTICFYTYGTAGEPVMLTFHKTQLQQQKYFRGQSKAVVSETETEQNSAENSVEKVVSFANFVCKWKYTIASTDAAEEGLQNSSVGRAIQQPAKSKIKNFSKVNIHNFSTNNFCIDPTLKIY